MGGFLATDRIARLAARRPWTVIGIWTIVVAMAAILAMGVGDVITTEFALQNDPESARASQLIEDRLRGPEQAREIIIVSSDGLTVDDPEFRARVDRLAADIRGLGASIGSVMTYYETGADAMVSADRHRTLVSVLLTGKDTEAADNVKPLLDLLDREKERDRFDIVSIGQGSVDRAHNELSDRDARRGESIGLPVALMILLLVFGAGVAAGIPLVLAIVSIVVAVGISALIGRAFPLNLLVLNIITMIGLAVGIDYALFIVQRFREERSHGKAKLDAIERAGRTSGRAVLFSGGTVVVGLMGLLIVPSNVYRSIAIGAIAVAAVSVIAALTLLPAVLSLLDTKVNALKVPFLGRGGDADNGGFWHWVTRLVTARPVASVAIATSLLIAAAIPYFTINPGLAGVSILPSNEPVRRAFEILEEDFDGGAFAPVEIVVDGDANATPVREAVARLAGALSADGAFGTPAVQTNTAGDLTLISVPLTGDPQNDDAHAAVRRLRSKIVPTVFEGAGAQVLVTGQTATEEDLFATIAQYTPYVFAFVLGLSFLLLLLVFRSIVVPIKALLMNLLSVGASYGLLVLVFQHGVGNELFGFQRTETIEAWLPLFLFSILFGLSMDYHVFLLSRIRERFDETGDNAASVVYGLRTTAGLITGAALIMVAVFTGFALGDLAHLQQAGFGLAVAVILDATVVRSVLVPASMELLGDLNWYLPRWLEWLPRLRIEEADAMRADGRSAFGTAAGGD